MQRWPVRARCSPARPRPRHTHASAWLAGIVQALLMTKHVLFVGFSLDDDNFHRCAPQPPRRARGQRLT